MNQAQIHLVELCGSRLFLSYSSVCVCVSCVTVLKGEQEQSTYRIDLMI